MNYFDYSRFNIERRGEMEGGVKRFQVIEQIKRLVCRRGRAKELM